jgi:hypothetical protein
MQETAQALIRSLELLTAGSFAVGVILGLLAVAYFRRSRTEAFWRFRRQAGQRGFRTSLAALFFIGVSLALCITTVTIDYVETRDTSSDLALASPTASLSPTPDSSPSPIVIIVTATPLQGLPNTNTTLGPTPSVEPSPTLAQPSPTPTINATPGASVVIQALDDVISDALQPIQPAQNFPGGVMRLYAFFVYDNMQPGDIWHQRLFRDGQLLQERTQRWGLTNRDGQAFFFFGDSDGFAPGDYEIRLSYGPEDILLASSAFTIQTD